MISMSHGSCSNYIMKLIQQPDEENILILNKMSIALTQQMFPI